MISRRHLLAAGSLAIPCVPQFVTAQSSTPIASPVSSAPVSDAIVPAWQAAQRALADKAAPIVAAMLRADAEAIAAVADEQVASLVSTEILEQGIDLLTRNQVQFNFPEANAWFFGQYTPEYIAGNFMQNSRIGWIVRPEEEQTGPVPVGIWSGSIAPGDADLPITLEFRGDAETFAVNLSIPTQGVFSVPMSSVLFAADLPIGDLVDTRSGPYGGTVTGVNQYGEEYAWGDHSIVAMTSWDTSGLLAGITITPSPRLPDIEMPAAIQVRMPSDGAWLVFWGGETAFRNYHVGVQVQRTACDIVIWQDGATATSGGSRNEDYWCFGQPLLAPVDGTVAAAVDSFPDIPPQTAGDPTHHPAGNHIVIETEGGFVLLAHAQQGSVTVKEGDVVVAGDQIANVGNSGNTSEPHIHIHGQSVADMFDPSAMPIPLVFTHLLVNGEIAEDQSLQADTVVEQAN